MSWQLEERSRNKYPTPIHPNTHHKGKSGHADITGPDRISGVPQLLDQSRLKRAVTKEKRKYNTHFLLCFVFVYPVSTFKIKILPDLKNSLLFLVLFHPTTPQGS